ncbi:MAG TPA: hypothetical protein VF487_13260 [Chitinophagaceae bacterium]
MSYLKRIDGKAYFREFTTDVKSEAVRKKENFKTAGFKARVIPTQSNGKPTFSVYVNHLPIVYNKNKTNG